LNQKNVIAEAHVDSVFFGWMLSSAFVGGTITAKRKST